MDFLLQFPPHKSNMQQKKGWLKFHLVFYVSFFCILVSPLNNKIALLWLAENRHIKR